MYPHQKRPAYLKKRLVHIKRDLSICKETYPFEKRPILIIRDVSKRPFLRIRKGVPHSLVLPWALP